MPLITDYIQVSGLGAALVNSGLVTLISLLILYLSRTPCNGMTLVVIRTDVGLLPVWEKLCEYLAHPGGDLAVRQKPA